ncbi:HAD family hydrolase [Candidatus Parcubacteria bacterium]|nr:HAD family hydrolase [Candidatus Parcubacteria bacterium]
MKEKKLTELGIRNLILDHCGTLVDDLYLVYKVAMFIFEELGLKTISQERFKRESEIPYMKFYGKFTNVPKSEIDKLFVQGLEILEPNIEVSLFPGIEDMLNFLDMEGIELAVLSSFMQKNLEFNLKRFGIETYFKKRIVGDADDKVEGLKQLLAENNFKSEETAYVGDMVYDIIAGKEAGLGMTIAVLWGFDSKEKLIEANPDDLIESPNDIVRLFI